MAGHVEHSVGSRNRHGRRRVSNPACRVAEIAVSIVFDVPVAQLRAAQRGPAAVSLARQVAMYLAHVVLRQRSATLPAISGATAPRSPMPAGG
jgi:hypothetical protein